MTTTCQLRSFLLFFATVSAGFVHAQQPAELQQQKANQPAPKNSEVSPPTQPKDTIVFSGVATTAHVADPNEQVVFSGRVMRMADFVAAVSSNSGAVQRLHTPEKRNRETDQPTQPPQP